MTSTTTERPARLGSIERAIEIGILLRADEVAVILAVENSEWVMRQYRAGNLAGVKLGHYVRFDPNDLPGFIASMKR